MVARLQDERIRLDVVAARPSDVVLLGAIGIAVVAQGGFYLGARVVVTALLVTAAVLSRRVGRGAQRLLVALAALAGWAIVSGAVAGHTGQAIPTVAAVAVVAAGVVVAGSSTAPQRNLLATGLVVVGAFVAASGWIGVVFRIQPLAHPDGGLWRAATSITYANAAAAFIGPMALLAIVLLLTRPTTATKVGFLVLLVGLGATASRAGIVAFVVGLGVVAGLLGWRRTAAAAAPSVVGAAIAYAGVASSMQVGGPRRPAVAVIALAVGIAVAFLPIRRVALVAVCVVLGGLAVVAVSSGSVWNGRLTLSSPDRSAEARAAVDLFRSNWIAGVGPGRATLIWQTPQHQLVFDQYAHDEYLQLAAEEGVVGVLLLAAVAALIVRTGRVSRDRTAAWVAGVGGLCCLGVQSGFDFIWHIPAALAVVGVLIGFLLPPPQPTAQPKDIS